MFFDTFSALCKEKKVSCKRATLEMGLSNSIAAKWKRTGATPNGETLSKIADYFNVSIEYLLGTENEKSPTPEGAELTDLEKDILERMSRLTPEDRVRVDAYIQGLLAARED